MPKGLPKPLVGGRRSTALLDAVVGDDPLARRDRAILEVLYGTGLRISELVGPVAGRPRPGRRPAAGARQGIQGARSCPSGGLAHAGPGRLAGDRRAATALAPERWARRGDAEALFLNQRGSRLSRQGAWQIVRRYGERSGLADHLSPHVLRHSCATHMLDHGADIRVVQELLGHASLSTTQVYTLVSTERIWSVYRSAHPRAAAPPGRARRGVSTLAA